MNNTLLPLYKRTEIGQIQEWSIFVENDEFYTIEGIHGGKLTTSARTKCVGKNIGRANERTPSEQALFEAKAKWKKKTEEGYTLDIKNIDNAKQDGYKPMLAVKYDDYKDRVKYPCFIQPKLDGIRCLMTKDNAYFRKGKVIVTIPHIQKALIPFFNVHPTAVLDGELYNHTLHEDFNKITSIIKKTKPTKIHFKESERLAQYHIYDMPRLNDKINEKTNFSFRFELLKQLLSKCNDCIQIVETIKMDENCSFSDIHDSIVSKGYEGIIIRNNTPYEQKRSRNLFKYKVFDTEEFIIDDIHPGVGGKANMAAKVWYHTKNGHKFSTGINGTESYCKQVLKEKNKYIGKLGTVKFFGYTTTETPVPRFGKTIELDRKDI